MKLPHTSLEEKHIPVMLNEVIKICSPQSSGVYLDCTFGAGGYSKAILKFSLANLHASIDTDGPLPIITKSNDII